MTPEERTTMIQIGKAVTKQGKTLEEMIKIIENHIKTPPKATLTPFDIPRPDTLSVVEQEISPQLFKMEIGFEQGMMWTAEQRKAHSVKLLRALEDIFRQFGVATMSGNFDKYGLQKLPV